MGAEGTGIEEGMEGQIDVGTQCEEVGEYGKPFKM